MSQTITLGNFVGNITKQVKLTDDTLAGVNALQVQNSVGFNGVSVLLGNPGSPTCELLVASTPANSTTVSTVGNTLLPHNNGEQVSILFGTSMNIYRAVDSFGTGQQPLDADFTLLATVVIDPTQAETSYTDASSGDYWYKYTFLNTGSSTETPLADSVAVRTGGVHYVSLQEIREAAGFKDAPQVQDDKISRFRNAAEKEVNGKLLPVYQFPLPQPTNPIIVEITKNIAAGELMREEYINIAPTMVARGEQLSGRARNGGGSETCLQDLVGRVVVLEDANFNELTIEEGHGFGGWPDNTTASAPSSEGGDHGRQFTTDEVY